MALFAPPQPTRYDLRFTVAGIPVRVHPLFWLMAVLFGASTNNLIYLLVWVAVVFVSIVVHELGHAFVFRLYGQRSQVVLHVAGGLTVPEPSRWGNSSANVSLRPGQEVLVSLGGPFAGFLLAGLVMLVVVAVGGSVVFSTILFILPMPTAFLPTSNAIANLVVVDLLWVSIFWGLINLLPVYPLDGGNVARYVLLKIDPRDGIQTSIWLSVIVAGIVAVLGLLFLHSIYMALLFAYLAFLSYQSLPGRSRYGY